jgi:8-hydroxy-5-deazaflavin:NADPH oxidoreductase
MRVGILGSGLMGGKLGTIFARAGHEVVFSYSRSSDKLKRLAWDAGANARAGTPREAAQEADALLLAVHWLRIDDVLSQTGDLSDKVIVSCSLPMNAHNTELVLGHTSSGAEELAKRVPKARVVSAFNTIRSKVLFSVFESVFEGRHKGARPSLVYCGDDSSSKRIASELIRDVGFDPVDAGPLRIARYTEPFALLVGQLAYEGKRSPELAYRFERLGKWGDQMKGAEGKALWWKVLSISSGCPHTGLGRRCSVQGNSLVRPSGGYSRPFGPQTGIAMICLGGRPA